MRNEPEIHVTTRWPGDWSPRGSSWWRDRRRAWSAARCSGSRSPRWRCTCTTRRRSAWNGCSSCSGRSSGWRPARGPWSTSSVARERVATQTAAVLKRIRASRVICSDETSARVAGPTRWEWVFVGEGTVPHELAASRAKSPPERARRSGWWTCSARGRRKCAWRTKCAMGITRPTRSSPRRCWNSRTVRCASGASARNSRTAPCSATGGTAEAAASGAGTGADAGDRDPAAQPLPEGAGAVAGVHERPGGADDEQRVGAGLAADRSFPQGDERLPGGVGWGSVRGRADGGGHGPAATVHGTGVMHDPGGRQHPSTACGPGRRMTRLLCGSRPPRPILSRHRLRG